MKSITPSTGDSPTSQPSQFPSGGDWLRTDFRLHTRAEKELSVLPMKVATHLLPYRGLGSGIPRALKAWAGIDLVDDREGNQFKAIVRRGDVISQIGL